MSITVQVIMDGVSLDTGVVEKTYLSNRQMSGYRAVIGAPVVISAGPRTYDSPTVLPTVNSISIINAGYTMNDMLNYQWNKQAIQILAGGIVVHTSFIDSVSLAGIMLNVNLLSYAGNGLITSLSSAAKLAAVNEASLMESGVEVNLSLLYAEETEADDVTDATVVKYTDSGGTDRDVYNGAYGTSPSTMTAATVKQYIVDWSMVTALYVDNALYVDIPETVPSVGTAKPINKGDVIDLPQYAMIRSTPVEDDFNTETWQLTINTRLRDFTPTIGEWYAVNYPQNGLEGNYRLSGYSNNLETSRQTLSLVRDLPV